MNGFSSTKTPSKIWKANSMRRFILANGNNDRVFQKGVLAILELIRDYPQSDDNINLLH